MTIPTCITVDAEFGEVVSKHRLYPDIDHPIDGGDLGSFDVTIDLEDYAEEVMECVNVVSVAVTTEDIVRGFRDERELTALFSELVRQCGVGELERAFKASLS